MIKSTQSNRPSHWATPWSDGSLGGEGLLSPLLNVLGWFCFQSQVYEILYISFPTISCPFNQCSMLLFQAIFHSFKFLFSICRKPDNKALFGIISVFECKFKGAQLGIGSQIVGVPVVWFLPRTQRVRLLKVLHKSQSPYSISYFYLIMSH